jgi:very-short-patch-repair endonuclease
LWDRPPAVVDVIARGQRGRKIDGIRRRYVPALIPEEVSIRNAVPCTSPSRTLVDLGGVLGERSLRRSVERAAVLGVLDVPAIDAALTRRRRRGGPLLRMILEDWRARAGKPHLRSDMEARLLALFSRHGLPTPLCNQRIKVDGGRWEVDFLWPTQRLIVEADGRRFHDTPIAFDRDRLRDRDLTLAGYRVVRITWTHLDREPEKTVAVIRRLLHRH